MGKYILPEAIIGGAGLYYSVKQGEEIDELKENIQKMEAQRMLTVQVLKKAIKLDHETMKESLTKLEKNEQELKVMEELGMNFQTIEQLIATFEVQYNVNSWIPTCNEVKMKMDAREISTKCSLSR